MIKEIIKDTNFLSIPSVDATENDIDLANDLKDTLNANKEICVGLAANMIGVNKKVICFYDNTRMIVMFNSKIISHSRDSYEIEEGCLSLDGVRKTTRFKTITVEYLDEKFRLKTRQYKNFVAEIIQHEIDHFSGKLM